MNNHQYYEELAIQLKQHGLQLLPIFDSGLPAEVHDTQRYTVIPAGKTAQDLATMFPTERDAIAHRAKGIIHTVKEYMSLMETAPQIKASSLEGDYRMLAEYNSVILAGHPTKFGVQFVTWEWTNDHTALWQGHYTDSYATAKKDFATRSGLIAKERLFTNQQLAEMYRCVHETLDSGYPLTTGREQLLKDVCHQIEQAIPSLNELIQKSNQAKLLTPEQAGTPDMTQQF